MSFLNLPDDWPDRPLSDLTIAADIVDLCVTEGDRRRGVLKVIFCDERTCFHGCIEIGLRDRHDTLQLTNPRMVIEPVVTAARAAPDTGIVLALGRPGAASWPAIDNTWSDTATALCAEADLHLLGFYTATADAIRRLEAPVHV